ncbi:zwei Ig domain protein zig-8-like [Culicoides brevitarsis]|uniref:zwei Ig domain protein zig-8-like n=1 Tax=Culicoides brevitarsis TaxID=469753 RepID=UPI00307C7C28
MENFQHLIIINILIILISANGNVYGQTMDRTTNFPYVDDSFIMDNYENFEEMVKTPLDRGPYFDISASKNVTALVGTTAYLNCRVRNLQNRTVSWIRHKDLRLLTSGKMTYTADQRFQAVHNPISDDWSLKVLFAQKLDSGVYECQISTTPPVGYTMSLAVVEPITNILGGPDLYIEAYSTINLTCVVHHLPEPPNAIMWSKDGQEINYDSARGGVSVITEKGETTTSYLLVQRAKQSDSGTYKCSPSNAIPVTIQVHVLNAGEYPAAMQSGYKTSFNNISILLISTALLWSWR